MTDNVDQRHKLVFCHIYEWDPVIYQGLLVCMCTYQEETEALLEVSEAMIKAGKKWKIYRLVARHIIMEQK